MNRSWMNFPRVSVDYRNGVETFLDFAFANASQEDMILCPCKKCGNINWHIREVVHEHLIVCGFVRGYIKWIFHGEITPRRASSTSNSTNPLNSDHRSHREDDMEGMPRDAFNMHDYHQSVREDCDIGVNDSFEMGRSGCHEEPNGEAAKFYNLLDEMNEQLYEEFLGEMFPFAKIPQSSKDMKKVINDLGLGYEKNHSCPNDCMLYWGDRKN
ncbi:hypothetical protein HRI_001394400 [Hibiscus trionum]|uniref:Transposase-associated domain-containing protein n=1 Tax=Hibiscus trionum TaxID=183268 RepID=A0A9W7HH18_HIBTR|nr:hypothetical protein HRI_001394400 [Hibiscus trionum]